MNSDKEFMFDEKILILFLNHFSFKRSFLEHIFTDDTHLLHTTPSLLGLC